MSDDRSIIVSEIETEQWRHKFDVPARQQVSAVRLPVCEVCCTASRVCLAVQSIDFYTYIYLRYSMEINGTVYTRMITTAAQAKNNIFLPGAGKIY